MKQRSYTADTPGLSALLLCDIVTQRGNVVNEEISKDIEVKARAINIGL